MAHASQHSDSVTPAEPGRPVPERGDWVFLRGRLAHPNAALAFLFVMSGILGAASISVPNWGVAKPWLVYAVAAAGMLVGALTWLLRHRLTARDRHLLLAIGSLAISIAIVGCGAWPMSMVAAYFYIWVVLYAAVYFTPRAAVAHLALVGFLYAGALAVQPQVEFLGQWLVAMWFLTITTLTVGGFAIRLRRESDALTYQTCHDSLTGLGNRALFVTRIDRALGELEPGDAIAILLLDIDDFKTVNDSLGHAMGDELLVSVARRLESITRAVSPVARIGGDEFALLLESGQIPQTATLVAGRITDILRPVFRLGEADVTVTVSIGLAVGQPSLADSEQLLRDAELAMYLAKDKGKGRLETFQPGMEDKALTQLSLRADLRRAVERKEFEVFFQPILRISDQRPVGVEALIRWHHPRSGLVLPAEFIGEAEIAGLVVPIGDWVLSEACRQAQAWRVDGTTDDDFYISVNLAPRQLAEPTVIDAIARALHESGLPPGALVLEITESSLMLDQEVGLVRLSDVQDLGVRLALDDFGTGYSSLTRLQKCHVDIVKIDKSFVDHVCQGPEGRALVKSVIDVASALGVISIAEGVETPDQFRALRELGCDAVQGFLFAKPARASQSAHTMTELADRARSDPDTTSSEVREGSASSADDQSPLPVSGDRAP